MGFKEPANEIDKCQLLADWFHEVHRFFDDYGAYFLGPHGGVFAILEDLFFGPRIEPEETNEPGSINQLLFSYRHVNVRGSFLFGNYFSHWRALSLKSRVQAKKDWLSQQFNDLESLGFRHEGGILYKYLFDAPMDPEIIHVAVMAEDLGRPADLLADRVFWACAEDVKVKKDGGRWEKNEQGRPQLREERAQTIQRRWLRRQGKTLTDDYPPWPLRPDEDTESEREVEECKCVTGHLRKSYRIYNMRSSNLEDHAVEEAERLETGEEEDSAEAESSAAPAMQMTLDPMEPSDAGCIVEIVQAKSLSIQRSKVHGWRRVSASSQSGLEDSHSHAQPLWTASPYVAVRYNDQVICKSSVLHDTPSNENATWNEKIWISNWDPTMTLDFLIMDREEFGFVAVRGAAKLAPDRLDLANAFSGDLDVVWPVVGGEKRGLLEIKLTPVKDHLTSTAKLPRISISLS